jgi:hypothetical protein
MYTVKGGKLRKHIIIHPDSDSESDEEGRGLYAGGGSGLYAGGGSGLYAGKGGSIGSKMKSAFKSAGKYITAKNGGLASALVNQGIPGITGALGGMAGEFLAPEAGPISGFAGAQLGAYGGRELAGLINRSAGTGFPRPRGRPRKSMSAGDLIHIDVGSHNARRDIEGGKLKMDLVKAYNKVVPKSMQPAVNELAGQVGNYALDKAGYGTPIPVKGGKLKNDLVKAYNKVVPKSMQPAVNNLAGQVGNYALDKAGYGTPIPTGKGFKKGSQAAKDHMARIRAMKRK